MTPIFGVRRVCTGLGARHPPGPGRRPGRRGLRPHGHRVRPPASPTSACGSYRTRRTAPGRQGMSTPSGWSRSGAGPGGEAPPARCRSWGMGPLTGVGMTFYGGTRRGTSRLGLGSGQGSGSNQTRLQRRPLSSKRLSQSMPWRITLTVRAGRLLGSR